MEAVDKDQVNDEDETRNKETVTGEDDADGEKTEEDGEVLGGRTRSIVGEDYTPPVAEVQAPPPGSGSGHVTDMSSMQEGSASANWYRQREEIGLTMTAEAERMRQKMAGKDCVFAKVKFWNEMNEHKFVYNGPVMKLVCGYLNYREEDVGRKDWGGIRSMLRKGMTEARNRLRNAIRKEVKGKLLCDMGV
jgi:hypothetical protein